jgi:hypothetical protein
MEPWRCLRAACLVAGRTGDCVSGYADAENAPRRSRLWLVPATGGMPWCLTMGFNRHLEIADTAAPIWRADGTALIVGSRTGVRWG